MTSLIGGNSILHIANRLGGMKKEVPNEGLDSETAPSPTPPAVRQPTPLSAAAAAFPEVPSNVASSPAPPPAGDDPAVVLSLFKEKDAVGSGLQFWCVADLLPGYSPWMRNAGRKKSHPVWEFFKDLKDTNGVGGVVCLHCSWQGDDRSPNNLRTHLKKFHSSDGVFARFSEKLAQVSSSGFFSCRFPSIQPLG
ncbi:hypothetical protein Y032_0039g154 [Ancylostoma ceylanicum]|uniref:BED-type domain-containing protein n=1 Tax=Ancylostoma ceylanicum TaxID=53326 RepID=A0A016UJP7_9BILA|nr:hypothetical protein Y032_0039g154 [Ancylostoma ceylanicum]